MTLPDVVRTALDDEPVLDRIALGGENELLVTPTRLLRYRSEGLLSGESVEEFPYDAERVSSSKGRRTATITLEYVHDERTLSVPVDRFETVLQSLLDGVLSAGGVTDGEEETIEVFRFDELTVVVTDRRLIKHVGAAVWDGEYEKVRFEDVTGFEVERGRLTTGIVLIGDGHHDRLKIRNERARAFEECVRGAIRAYHGVESLNELADERLGAEGPEERTRDVEPIDTGVAPLGIDRSSEKRTTGGDGVPATSNEDADPPRRREIERELEAMASAVEQQEALLAEQRRTIDRLRKVLTHARGR